MDETGKTEILWQIPNLTCKTSALRICNILQLSIRALWKHCISAPYSHFCVKKMLNCHGFKMLSRS